MGTEADTIVVQDTPEPVQQQQGETAGGVKPFVCDLCKSSYTRLDHLARHFRGHHENRPFTCPHCKKRFVRADILKRHMNIHKRADAAADAGPTAKRRIRASRACISCAESKLRCEGDVPCQRCKERGTMCQYPRRGRPKNAGKQNDNPSAPSQSELYTFPVDSGQPALSSAETNPATRSAPFENLTNSSTIPAGDMEFRSLDLGMLPTMTELHPDPARQLLDTESSATGVAAMHSSHSLPQSSQSPLFQDFFSANFSGEIVFPDDAGHIRADTSLLFSTDQIPMDILNLDPDNLQSPCLAINPFNHKSLNSQITQSFSDLHRHERAKSDPCQDISLGEDAFKRSFWLYNPVLGEHWRAKASELSPSLNKIISECIPEALEQDSLIHLSSSTRYHVLSLFLSLSAFDSKQILASFPSVKTLNYLLWKDLECRKDELDSWVHCPSFDPNSASPEVVIGLVISGALRCNRAIFWRLGLALLEVQRLLCAQLFANDCRNTRLLEPLQSFVLCVESCLWSGNGRLMEMSEGTINALITMVRRGGLLNQQHFESGLWPQLGDSLEVLDSKWRAWVEHESKKRLVIHLLILSTQHSLAFLTHPLISHMEVSVPLPATKALWEARSAMKWRSVYLALETKNLACLPLLRDCIEDFNGMLAVRDVIDTKCAALAVLCGLWLYTWQYKERLMAQTLPRGNIRTKNALIAPSLQREAQEILEDFKAFYTDLSGPMEPCMSVLCEQQLMHLYVCLEHVQLLGGKAGKEEAHRVLPQLSEWASSQACRQALWHAGQVLRAGPQDCDWTLRFSTDIAMYHASLTLWAYSVLSHTQSIVRSVIGFRPCLPQQRQDSNEGLRFPADTPEILLDGEYSQAVQRFLRAGIGRAAISQRSPQSELDGNQANIDISCDRVMMMEAIGASLREKYLQKEYVNCPCLVENLSQLIARLGYAAEAMPRWLCDD